VPKLTSAEVFDLWRKSHRAWRVTGRSSRDRGAHHRRRRRAGRRAVPALCRRRRAHRRAGPRRRRARGTDFSRLRAGGALRLAATSPRRIASGDGRGAARLRRRSTAHQQRRHQPPQPFADTARGDPPRHGSQFLRRAATARMRRWRTSSRGAAWSSPSPASPASRRCRPHRLRGQQACAARLLRQPAQRSGAAGVGVTAGLSVLHPHRHREERAGWRRRAGAPRPVHRRRALVTGGDGGKDLPRRRGGAAPAAARPRLAAVVVGVAPGAAILRAADGEEARPGVGGNDGK
jgi:hypothetical protein